MNTITLSTFSQEQPIYNYSILGDLHVSIQIQENPYNIPLNSLFEMAARINKKRGFLFVSKVLGKHIPVKPSTSLLSGAALAARFMEVFYQRPSEISAIIEGLVKTDLSNSVFKEVSGQLLSLPEPVIFIGFAETATALGHSVFSRFQSQATYVHTTREIIEGIEPVITFEEEHSHAVAHRFYPIDLEVLRSTSPIVLIDDEITTGRTALNIIREIQSKYPRKHYAVVSLLDWRSKEDCLRYKETEEELGIQITSVSLLKGEIQVSGSPVGSESDTTEYFTSDDVECVKEINLNTVGMKRIAFPSINSTGSVNYTPYLQATGRFGLCVSDQRKFEFESEALGTFLQKYRTGKTLCMGTGEFMYVPMMLSAYMGEEVWYQSTTRSPIHPADCEGYAVKNKASFICPDDPAVTNYFYNIPEGYYDDLFVFIERKTDHISLKSFYQAISKFGIPNKIAFFFSGERGK
ncbi:phosphoribosyltransferase family protein [Brevibacillus sp. GCM10020057]|uniref:phosphoribosyltransferase family protein n=1 Tax=Brevibacillus sp. GCM10020057 TaxID=3317327 RepID=UPI00363E12A3